MKIRDIIRENQQSAPVDIEKMADAFGVEVRKENLGADISGKIIKERSDGNEKFVIISNSTEDEIRQRFTIAHELSHFILHQDLIGDGITENTLYRNGLSNEVEDQANRLATDMLMPMHLIEQLSNTENASIDKMASILRVSLTSLMIRLKIPVTD